MSDSDTFTMTEVEAQSMRPRRELLYVHRPSPLIGFCTTTEYMDTMHHHLKRCLHLTQRKIKGGMHTLCNKYKCVMLKDALCSEEISISVQKMAVIDYLLFLILFPT